MAQLVRGTDHTQPHQEVPKEVPKGQRELIVQELERILESHLFRSSKRCQQFLRYSVQHVLDGEFDHLKERSIGIAVFERPAAYDTGEDSIVRVTAKEVRSRLVQYYAGLAAEPPVRLEIAPGSYQTEFRWPEGARAATPLPTVAEAAEPKASRLFPWWLVVVGVALIAVVASAGLYPLLFPAKPDLLRRFWEPVLDNSKPVLICVANPVVYQLADSVFPRFGARDTETAVLAPLQLPDNGVVYGRELIASSNGYLAVGDTIAATRLAVLFARLGKNAQVRTSTDISFSDLRSSPAVLIGAFTNAWTLELMKEWRFVFDIHSGWVIRDRNDPARAWANPALKEDLRVRQITEDYALISRVFEERSGQPLVSVAGLTEYGTAAAAEFLTDETELTEAFAGAPKGWDRKNLQLVIKTQVVGRTSSKPQFIARHIW